MKDLTLVIPAKAEKESLPAVLDEIKRFNCKKKIVLSDKDYETIEVAKNCSDLEILYQKKPGVGSAIIEGIESSKTKYFCILMADGSTDPKYLESLYSKCENDNLDLVFSSRYQKPGGGSDDDTLITLIGNYFFSKLVKFLFSINLSDILYNFVLGKTESFKLLKLKSKDHRICVELPIKAKFKNYRYSSLPSFERKRFGGEKKVNALKDGFLILVEIIKLFFKKI